ncbi:hypothetical protein L195_g049004, partial [Trifolium pratense]
MLLKEFHSTPTGGHSGYLRTYRRLAENLYWIGMQRTVRDFVRACDVCQRQKYDSTTPGGLLQPLPVPNAIWEDLSLDFITGLPKSKGFEAILVVVDRLSKYGHGILLKHPYTAKSVAELFVKEIVRLHAVAVELSERDEALNQLKVHLSRAQEQMKHQADKKRRQVTFEVVGDYQVQGDLPKELEVTDAEDVYPDQVLGSRVDMRGGVSVPQSLIKWKNRSI